MTALYLYDDARARQFEPFALTRPVSELRVGARLIRERWELALGMKASGFIGAPVLADFEEFDAPPAAVTGILPAGSIVANARCVPVLSEAAEGDAWVCAGEVAAVRLTDDVPVERFAGGSLALGALATGGVPTEPLDGWWLAEVWDLIREMEVRLADDLRRLTLHQAPRTPDQCAHLGPHGVFVARDAVVEPFVTFDCTAGPVVIEHGAHVQSFTRMQGPTWVGPHSVVGGDRIAACAIGEHCKVHGEISNAVVIGYSNKAHDGFVGHSYAGRWVNLGANTTTSNLKNTYGPVDLWTPEGVKDTGLQFLGTFFGDHAKTGIGLTLTTGTVMGAGAQVYGAEMPAKVIPPFAWGDHAPYDVFDLEKFLLVAERVMARRKVRLGENERRQLARAHADRWMVEADA